MDRRKDNIKRGHIYLVDILTKEQINRLKEKYNSINNFFDASSANIIKINYEQFPTLTTQEVNTILKKHGFEVRNNIVIPSGFSFGTRYLNLKPIIDDIYINEIFFLKFLNNKTIDFYFSPYWIFNFCILDKDYTINKFLDAGYLLLDYSISRFLTNKTVVELKEILENNHIEFKRNLRKSDLINLIIENNLITQSEVSPTYCLTDKGQNLIDNCEIFFINKAIEFPIFEYDLQKEKDLYYWFNQYKENYMNIHMWGFLRNLYLSFSKLKDNNKEQFLFNCFILDISGLTNSSYDNLTNVLINRMYKKAFPDGEYLLNNSIYDELPFNYLSKIEILDILQKINEL